MGQLEGRMNMKGLVISIWLLGYLSIPLRAEIKTEVLWKWKGMDISWSYDTDDPGDRKLEFKSTNKNIESKSFDVDYETVLEKGEYRIDKQNFFYMISHSGGESGGSLFLRIFYPHKKKLEHIFLETSGYGVIKFVDFDGKGNEEVYVYNQDFYGLHYVTDQKKACINLPPVYQSGFNKEFIFPRYYQLTAAKEEGKFELKDVTFTPDAEKSVSSYMKKIEKYLEINKNSVIQDEYMIPPIFQYYDYQKRFGNEAKVLKKLQELRIRYESSCDEKQAKKRTYLGLLLREYFKKDSE